MSVTRAQLDQARLELEEKILKIANVQADTTLKEAQPRFEPWNVVSSGVAAVGGLTGASGATGALLARALLH